MNRLSLFFIRIIQISIVLVTLMAISASYCFQEPIEEIIKDTIVLEKEVSIDLGPFHQTFFEQNPEYISKGFDFPIGKPNAENYYNAQGFQVNQHLGEDWNGVGGGDTDLGDSIFAIANGYVSQAEDLSYGWGNVIRIVHYLKNENRYVESLYAHCDSIGVIPQQKVKKGDFIGTIGTAHGAYLAHLHFEIRDTIGLGIGGGYSTETNGYLNPTEFILGH